jgi:hypothetical protein
MHQNEHLASNIKTNGSAEYLEAVLNINNKCMNLESLPNKHHKQLWDPMHYNISTDWSFHLSLDTLTFELYAGITEETLNTCCNL